MNFFSKNLAFLIVYIFLCASFCSAVTLNVDTPDELKKALSNANPGDTIKLADGVYKNAGGFKIQQRSGTKLKPISLIGSKKAVLTTGDINSGNGLWLINSDFWILNGFSVKDSKKGIMLDSSSNNLIENVLVSNIGQEGIHFRCGSSDNTLKSSSISFTGRDKNDVGFGEAVYIGTAVSNWNEVECLANKPDESNRNRVIENTLGPQVTAECVDIKEGTSGGLIQGNSFDGSSLAGEDAHGAISWINCKGRDYKIVGNKGKNSLKYGFRTQNVDTGRFDVASGCNNEFIQNECSNVKSSCIYLSSTTTKCPNRESQTRNI